MEKAKKLQKSMIKICQNDEKYIDFLKTTLLLLKIQLENYKSKKLT